MAEKEYWLGFLRMAFKEYGMLTTFLFCLVCGAGYLLWQYMDNENIRLRAEVIELRVRMNTCTAHEIEAKLMRERAEEYRMLYISCQSTPNSKR